MGGYGTLNQLYGGWLHGQIKSLVDQAHKRKGEVPPEHSGDVQAAVAELEKILGKLHRYGGK